MYSMGNVCPYFPSPHFITSLDQFARPVYCIACHSFALQVQLLLAQHVHDAASRMATAGCARLTSGEGRARQRKCVAARGPDSAQWLWIQEPEVVQKSLSFGQEAT